MRQLALPTMDSFLQEEKLQRAAALPLLGKQLAAIRRTIEEHQKIRGKLRTILNDIHFRNCNDSDSYLDMHEAEIRCLNQLIDQVDSKPLIYFANDEPCREDALGVRAYRMYGVILGYSSIDGELCHNTWQTSDVKSHRRSESAMRDAWNFYGDRLVLERRLTVFVEMVDMLIANFQQMHYKTVCRIKEQMPNGLARFTSNIEK